MVLIFDLKQKISKIALPLLFSSGSSNQSAANSNKVHEPPCTCFRTSLTLSSSTLPSWGIAVQKQEKKKSQGNIFISLRGITSDVLVWDHGSSVFWSLLCVVLSVTTAYIVWWAIYSRFRILPCAKTPRNSSWLPLIQSLCNMGCLKLFFLNLSYLYSSCFEELVSTDLITCPYISLLPAFQLFLLPGAIFFWHLPSPSTFSALWLLNFFSLHGRRNLLPVQQLNTALCHPTLLLCNKDFSWLTLPLQRTE